MPIFELTDTSRIAVVWFVAWTDTDYLAMVYRDADDKPWHATYRFRYYTDVEKRNDAFNTKDERSAYELTPQDQTREPGYIIAACDSIAKGLAAKTRADVSERIEVNGSVDDYIRLVSGKPWAHIKVSPKEPTVTM